MTEIIIELLSAGYVSCIAGDIGKQVKDDTVEIGLLMGYDNTLRKWWIRTDSIVSDGSTMTITSGTGAGTSITPNQYCTIAQIASRLVMNSGDLATYTADGSLTAAAVQASRIVDEKLRPYLTTNDALIEQISPYLIFKELPLDSVPAIISEITADIATALFFRRTFKARYDEGWLALAMKRMDDFIQSNFHRGKFNIILDGEQ
jgi:hypothetical protein